MAKCSTAPLTSALLRVLAQQTFEQREFGGFGYVTLPPSEVEMLADALDERDRLLGLVNELRRFARHDPECGSVNPHAPLSGCGCGFIYLELGNDG